MDEKVEGKVIIPVTPPFVYGRRTQRLIRWLAFAAGRLRPAQAEHSGVGRSASDIVPRSVARWQCCQHAAWQSGFLLMSIKMHRQPRKRPSLCRCTLLLCTVCIGTMKLVVIRCKDMKMSIVLFNYANSDCLSATDIKVSTLSWKIISRDLLCV